MNKKLYNVIFPLWFILLMPISWIYVIPANFVIDSIVLCILFKSMKVEIKKSYKSSILKVWIFGFVADIIGALILTSTLFIEENDIISAVLMNPFRNIFSFLIVFFTVAVSAYFIYLFNMKFSFKKLNLELKIKRKIAILLAVITAPYLFFIPMEKIYKFENPNLAYEIQENTCFQSDEIICSLKN